MPEYRFARHGEVSGSSGYGHGPGAILLSAGWAYPPILPDVSVEAAAAPRDNTATA